MTQNLLEEYENKPAANSKFYLPIIILFSAYLGFFFLDMFIVMENLTWHGFNGDWLNLLFTLLIPGIGFGFFLARYKIGWLISTVYISFIALAGIATLLYTIFRFRGEFFAASVTWRHGFIILMSTSISVLLQTKGIRFQYKISNTIWITAISFALFLAVVLIAVN